MAGEWKPSGNNMVLSSLRVQKQSSSQKQRDYLSSVSGWQHHIKLWSRSMCTKNKLRCPNLLELMKATVGTCDGVQGELMWATVGTCDGVQGELMWATVGTYL